MAPKSCAYVASGRLKRYWLKLCWCVEESCHFRWALLQCIPRVISAFKQHEAASPPGYVLTRLLDASASQSPVLTATWSWHLGISKNKQNEYWSACIVFRHTPYKRHPQVIHGMKSCKFSLFIPPLAGQWLEPSHLIWVHCGLGDWSQTVHGKTNKQTKKQKHIRTKHEIWYREVHNTGNAAVSNMMHPKSSDLCHLSNGLREKMQNSWLAINHLSHLKLYLDICCILTLTFDDLLNFILPIITLLGVLVCCFHFPSQFN